MTPAKVVMSWSGGKDSAMALLELRKDPRYEVVALLTSISSVYGRVSHHGVREELLELQAAAVGLPLDKLCLPSSADAPCTHEQYLEIVGTTMRRYRDSGVLLAAHGDIFLEDLRARREANLASIGMGALFPLWGGDTETLARRFIELGFRAYLACVNRELGAAFAGRAFDHQLLADLPSGIDPCGEYGEYHTFVWDGPLFDHPVDVTVGQVVERTTGIYADLLPAPPDGPPGASHVHPSTDKPRRSSP